MDAMANNKEYFVNLEDDESGGKNMALAEINLWEELMPWLLSHPNLNVAPLTQAEVDAVIGPDTGPLKGVIRLHYRSPLCKAIRGERPELAEQLLAKGASLRELDQVPEYSADFAKTILNTSTEVENALHGAGKVNVVKFLLDKGLKPRRGRLGFCIADLEMLKLVLQALGEDPRRFTVYDAYTDVNTSSTQYVTQRTFLQTAARYGSFESVVYLVEEAGCKQDILKVCADGKTLLGHACDGEREHAAVMTSFKTSFVKLNKPIPATILADKPNQKRWNEVISYLKSFDITKEVDPDAPKFTAQELQELGYSTDLSHFTSSRSSSASDFTAGSVPSTSTPPPAKVDQYGLPVDVYEWESLMLLSYLVKKNIFAKPESLEAADENPILKYSVTGSMAMDATKEDFDELFRDAASLPVQTRIALWSAICALRRDQASKAAAVAEARESAKAAAALAQQRNFSPMHVPTGAENREESKNEDSVGMTFARSAADEAGSTRATEQSKPKSFCGIP